MKRKVYGFIGILLILVVSLGFSGCQKSENKEESAGIQTKTGETTYPVKITDDMKTEVSIEKEPQKIVSLSPATTEIVFALGQGSKLVGRTDYCDYPAEATAVTSVGDFNAPNLEKIISLTPDLVLASDFISPEIREQIEAIGAKVVLYAPVSIDGVLDNIINTGAALNTNDKAKTLVEKMTADRKGIMDKAKTAEKQKTVFIDVGNFFSAGPGSMLDAMLTEVNGINVATDTGKEWPQLTTEQIIGSNPDVYISLFSTPEEIKAVPGFDKMTAIQNNNIPYYEFLSPDSNLVQRPGPRIVEGLKLLAEDIYPEIFTN